MSCAKGCCGSQAEHYRSLVVAPVQVGKAEDRALADYVRAKDAGLQPPDINRAGRMLRAVGG